MERAGDRGSGGADGRFAAVVLAGGAGHRLAGAAKPVLPVAGRPMLDRVLAAVAGAAPRVVVGPADLAVPAGVLVTREEPPGGGPVAAAAAGLALVPPEIPAVALLAADLPLLTLDAIAALRLALAGDAADAAVYLDADGRRQSLCGVWRAAALRAALDRLRAERGGRGEGGEGGDLAGASMRALFDGVAVAAITWTGAGPPPWFDCDTDADLRRAREWAR